MKNFSEQYGPWAVVTGASSGIGKEIAQILAGKKLNVVLVARRVELLEALAKKLEQTNTIEAKVVQADLATKAGVRAVANLAESLNVGLLVNNAGISAPFQPVTDQDMDTLEKMSMLNMLAPAELMHTFLRPMLVRGRGGIINVASTAAFQPMPFMANYAATKAYLLNLTDAVAAETRDRNIDFVTLCPGPTDTEITDHVGLDEGSFDKLLMSADKVAQAAVNALGKRDVVIPGLSNAVGAQLMQRVMPRRAVTGLINFVMRRQFAK